MTKREQLITEIVAFCGSKGLSEREFSEVAVQNPKFMGRLRRGIVTSRSMDTAERFMGQHAKSATTELRRLLGERRAPPAPPVIAPDAPAPQQAA